MRNYNAECRNEEKRTIFQRLLSLLIFSTEMADSNSDLKKRIVHIAHNPRRFRVIAVFVATIMLGVVVIACTSGVGKDTPPPEITATPVVTQTPAPSATELPLVTATATSEVTAEPVSQNGTTYINNAGGWQITFPASWDGWYEVKGHGNDNETGVYFIGKSAKAQQYTREGGLNIFFITAGKPDESSDSIREIGMINGVKYYFSTTTDSWLEVFDLNSTDLKEKKDAEKAREIYHGDPNFYDPILKTFKAIEPPPTPETPPTPPTLPLLETAPTPPPKTTSTYVNNAGSWQITFPNNWQGWYEIRETIKNKAWCIYFTGENGWAVSENCDMFVITAGYPDDDSDIVREIGTISGTKYYYSTGTDAPFADWSISDNESLRKEYIKVTTMKKDIDSILKTFKATKN